MDKSSQNVLTIRRVVESDLNELSSFLIACWQETYAHEMGKEAAKNTAEKYHSIERMTKALSDPTRVFLIALRDNKIAGTARAKPSDGGIIFLELLYVGNDYKDMGIGSHLLKRVLKPFGSAPVQLEVSQDNIVAIRFYEKHDFIEIDKSMDCMGGAVNVPTLLMQKG